MKNVIFALLTIVLLVGCVTGNLVQVSDTQTLGPKIIALDAPRVPWAIEIKNHLRAKGFKVLRWSTKTRVIEQTKSESVE